MGPLCFMPCKDKFRRGKMEQKRDDPTHKDVMKLQKLLKCEEEKAKRQLLEGPNPVAFKILSECILSKVILFNRRRQGEAAKMPLLTYIYGTNEVPNEDVMQCLSQL